MSKVIDRLILLLICAGCVIFPGELQYPVIAILTAVIYAGVAFYVSDSRVHPIINTAAGIALVLYDGFLPILPLIVYECCYGLFRKNYREIIALAVTAVGYLISVIIGRNDFLLDVLCNNPVFMYILIVSLFTGIYLAYNTVVINRLQREKLKIRDDSEELRQLMITKNRLMREQQDNNINMATLKERNRIAREIHDNVGHLLTRSLLQVGALRTICRDEPLSEALMGLQETLNESMTNVRNSVHDLHDESFDLRRGISELIERHTNFITHFDYDMSDSVPRKIKYCIFSIITEAFQNAEKYSNGDSVDILVREHPVIYQAVFRDNGQNSVIKESGIGLHNMQSRVDELGGTLAINNSDGFRIFISIPKKGEGEV